MRLYNLSVFDDIIAGTASTWYSQGDYDKALASADWLVIGASITAVSGTTPTLTVQLEQCCDGLNWIAVGSPVLNATSLSANGLYFGEAGAGGALIFMSYLRAKITLGGTTPQCRLKLYVTGRARGGALGRPPQRTDERVPRSLGVTHA
jgi:hypothetical protein